MDNVSRVIETLDGLRGEKLIKNYALGGAFAALFYTEVSRTYDIDVFIVLPDEDRSSLAPLQRIYQWATRNGFAAEQEHLLLHGIPVQLLAADSGLMFEAVENSQLLPYDTKQVPVIRPEYLIALYALAGGAKRRERSLGMQETLPLDLTNLHRLFERFQLDKRFLL